MTLDLFPLLDVWTYQFLLVFARIGSAIMLLPGIGDLRVPVRVRLLFGLALSMLTMGTVIQVLPQTPSSFGLMALQVVSIGAGLMTAGLVIIFTTGLDHLMLAALAHSYERLPAGQLPPMNDVADTVARTLSASFSTAIQLSAPFLVLGLAFNIGLALANRALPQLPVFFVGLPASLAGGLIVLMIAIPGILIGFAEAFEALFTAALP